MLPPFVFLVDGWATIDGVPASRQPLRVTVALAVTLAIVTIVSNRVVTAVLLPIVWWGMFRPLTRGEWVLGAFSAVFFLFQNYMSLKAGLFEFRFKDVLLMPYYEPFLWSFYFLSLKRFVLGSGTVADRLDWRAVAAVVATSVAFSLFTDSRALLLATLVSTGLLFLLFHTPEDVAAAAFALALGFIIELFGVSLGLWWYPAPDFLGIPYWFATMWLSVGLLGRRFLIPVSEWLARRILPQGA